PSSWHITDSFGRSHWVYFKAFTGTTSLSSQQNYKFVVDRVELQTAGGTATYQFIYKDDDGVVDQPTLIDESCYGFAAGYPTQYNLPLLREVHLLMVRPTPRCRTSPPATRIPAMKENCSDSRSQPKRKSHGRTALGRFPAILARRTNTHGFTRRQAFGHA